MDERRGNLQNVIVVGTDLGETGVCALREALHLARQLPGPQLHVVYVVDHEGTHDAKRIAALSERFNHAREQMRAHVAEICHAEQFTPAVVEEITLHPRIGSPAKSVLQVAIDHEADFVVVGTHGRTGISRWLDGSVSEEVVRQAHCPVIVAHAKNYRGTRRSERVAPPRADREDATVELPQMRMPERTNHIAGLL